MACWDLKEYDYSHTDIMNGKIETDVKKGKKSVFLETENFE